MFDEQQPQNFEVLVMSNFNYIDDIDESLEENTTAVSSAAGVSSTQRPPLSNYERLMLKGRAGARRSNAGPMPAPAGEIEQDCPDINQLIQSASVVHSLREMQAQGNNASAQLNLNEVQEEELKESEMPGLPPAAEVHLVQASSENNPPREGDGQLAESRNNEPQQFGTFLGTVEGVQMKKKDGNRQPSGFPTSSNTLLNNGPTNGRIRSVVGRIE